jgi:hypothetical protein
MVQREEYVQEQAKATTLGRNERYEREARQGIDSIGGSVEASQERRP